MQYLFINSFIMKSYARVWPMMGTVCSLLQTFTQNKRLTGQTNIFISTSLQQECSQCNELLQTRTQSGFEVAVQQIQRSYKQNNLAHNDHIQDFKWQPSCIQKQQFPIGSLRNKRKLVLNGISLATSSQFHETVVLCWVALVSGVVKNINLCMKRKLWSCMQLWC